MKATPNLLFRLEQLKDKFMLSVTTSLDSYDVSTPKVIAIKGWNIEEVPEKKGLFGHKAYKKLTEIYVQDSHHIGTGHVGVHDVNKLPYWFIENFEKWRQNFVAVREQLEKFNVKIDYNE